MGVKRPKKSKTKVPDYVRKNIANVNSRLGICSACVHFDEPLTKGKEEVWFIAFCKKTKLQCYVTRTSLVSCKFFKQRPGKSAVETMKALGIALVKSVKKNKWDQLKKAAKDELQNRL